MSERLGYTVVAIRPSFRGYETDELVESVGGIWPDIEPCLNHQAYCEGKAKSDLNRYGDVKYEIVEVRRLSPESEK